MKFRSLWPSKASFVAGLARLYRSCWQSEAARLLHKRSNLLQIQIVVQKRSIENWFSSLHHVPFRPLPLSHTHKYWRMSEHWAGKPLKKSWKSWQINFSCFHLGGLPLSLSHPSCLKQRQKVSMVNKPLIISFKGLWQRHNKLTAAVNPRAH